MRTFAFWKSARPKISLKTTALAVMLGEAMFSSPVSAVDLSETVQLHGFASQAYVSTTANRYFGPSDTGSFDFRELGVNLSWQAMPNLQFAAQVGSRKAGGTEANARPRFDYALVDFAFYNGVNSRGGVRIGRHRNPVGFYNLTRDVANTRPSIFLPESIYSDASRNLLLALDGAQLYGESRTAVGDFFLDVGAGEVILDSITKQSAKPATSYVGRLLYERDGGRLRLALTAADANVAFFQRPFADAKFNLKAYVLSAQYNEDRWSVTGEWVPELKSTLSGLWFPGLLPFIPPRILPDIKQTGESYYLQGTYRISPDWETLLRYDVQYSDKSDKSGIRNATATTPAHRFFAKDWTVGLGWNVRSDTKIRAEYHRVDGTGWLSSRENPIPMNTKQRWDMFVLQASYNF
ncbi:hypothetical protein FGKAn22_05770 [Ferrigenium kumadai]|uniref:Porin n=1 Tax=Ferrigenium kumadai TaxID=1682490 RepID=A0AAN1VZ31_9PROT|nr:hypothetical protein [Ferrigenium kumadai]BBI98884.1 hypothetical protein FGKAn22_05770 [Ferrigenium kumadai]